MTAPGRPAATEGRMSGDAEFGAMFNAAIRRRRPPEPDPEPEGYVHPGPADAGAGSAHRDRGPAAARS
jgi:hypothetical protein